MKVAIGADHRGFEVKEKIKEFLNKEGIKTKDFGTINDKKSCDYSDFAISVAKSIGDGKYDRGILICGTGIGMSITANKVKGVYAALCNSIEMASFSRRHNNANVITIGANYTKPHEAVQFVKTFLTEKFEGKRHKKRTDKVKSLESSYIDKSEIGIWQKEANKWRKEARKWQSQAWRR